MEMNIHPILSEEFVYFTGNSCQELNVKTGRIRYLTANLNDTAPLFTLSWYDCVQELNTMEFTDDFNNMIDTLRQGMLKSPLELQKYCSAHPDSTLLFNSEIRHGFRVNTGRYSYLLVCSFYPTECRLWLNAFSFLALDQHMREARNGIPILDLHENERFRMQDGGKLKAISSNGHPIFWTVRYLDKEHAVLFDELNQSKIHAIQELPVWEAKYGLYLLPLDLPMRAIHKSTQTRQKQ